MDFLNDLLDGNVEIQNALTVVRLVTVYKERQIR